jgi:ribulose-5-phosphate 4-epimerase/fuculose-1-phosphate aldolase
MIDDPQAADLITAYKILVNENILDGFGHVSIRSARDPSRFFMPYAMPPSLVTLTDVAELRIDDSQLVSPGNRRVNGERYIHGEIYKARPDVSAVIHSHSQEIIPFSISDVPLRPVVGPAGFLPLEIPNFDIRTARGAERGLLVTTAARGAALARTLGSSPAALMRGHGDVVVGSTIKQATVYAIYFDINARMQAAAIALGGKVKGLDDNELFEPTEFDVNRPWEHYRQKLLDASERALVDRTQFGLDQTQHFQ